MMETSVLGEGVDGCITSRPMWPCAKGTETGSHIDAKDPRYVSKIVSTKDTESDFLKMAARILGSDLSRKYLAALEGECKPANSSHPPEDTNIGSFKMSQVSVKAWPKEGQACGELKDNLELGKSISKDHKIMFISRYPMSVEKWVQTANKAKMPYRNTMNQIEKAIPVLLDILQRLCQNPKEQVINIDLHTGNLFVRLKPFEIGIADFGHCVSRLYGSDPSKSFYGSFLIEYIVKYEFYSGEYKQVPLESRLLNFCYKKNMDSVTPSAFLKSWSSDDSVREFSVGTTDIINLNREAFIKYLLTRPLFIAMIETIQSISKKLRRNPTDSTLLFQSLISHEKTVLDFILTRYMVISPINTITEELMGIYPQKPMLTRSGKGANSLVRFLIKAIAMPYAQDGSSLLASVKAVGDADLRLLWSDAIKGI